MSIRNGYSTSLKGRSVTLRFWCFTLLVHLRSGGARFCTSCPILLWRSLPLPVLGCPH